MWVVAIADLTTDTNHIILREEFSVEEVLYHSYREFLDGLIDVGDIDKEDAEEELLSFDQHLFQEQTKDHYLSFFKGRDYIVSEPKRLEVKIE